jgi:hypothetical protein
LKLKYIALFSILLIGACGVDTSQEQQASELCGFKSAGELANGLTVLKAGDGELCGSYRQGDKAIHFQALRGERLIFQENSLDPDTPPYAISARLLDGGGNPIAVALAEDGERVSDWLSQVGYLSDHEQDVSSSFVLARLAIDALANAVEGFDAEIALLARRAVTADPAYIADESVSSDVPDSIQKNSGWRYSVQIMKKAAFLDGVPADHSALKVNVRRPNGSSFNFVTCNHGTCADSPAMRLKCGKTVYSSSARDLVHLPCDRISQYGFRWGRHVCNDDTKVQYTRIVHDDRSRASTATCSDWQLRRRAPSCD